MDDTIEIPVMFTPTIPRGDQAVSVPPRISADEVFKSLYIIGGRDLTLDWITHNRLLARRGIYPLSPVNGITVKQAREEMRIFSHCYSGTQEARDRGRKIVFNRALRDRELGS